MQLLKRGIRHSAMVGVRPLNVPPRPVVGEAFTLRNIPMREDLSTPEVLANRENAQRRAIEEVPEGAVLVIDGRGRGDVAFPRGRWVRLHSAWRCRLGLSFRRRARLPT